jgi:hypothetical protein
VDALSRSEAHASAELGGDFLDPSFELDAQGSGHRQGLWLSQSEGQHDGGNQA